MNSRTITRIRNPMDEDTITTDRTNSTMREEEGLKVGEEVITTT